MCRVQRAYDNTAYAWMPGRKAQCLRRLSPTLKRFLHEYAASLLSGLHDYLGFRCVFRVERGHDDISALLQGRPRSVRRLVRNAGCADQARVS